GTGVFVRARSVYRSTVAPHSLSCLGQGSALLGANASVTSASPAPTGACVLARGVNGLVFLLGDSHANHWSPPIADWAGASDITAYERSYPGCATPVAAFTSSVAAARQQFPEDC